jgi:hypothetical protein
LSGSTWILDRPPMLVYRSRTGQEHDLEVYPHQFSPELKEQTFWCRHTCQMTFTVRDYPPYHDRSYPPGHDCTYPSFWHITSQLTSTQKIFFN